MLMSGVSMIRNTPLFITPWKKIFKFSRDKMRYAPVWVKFLQLPLEFWGTNAINKIASLVGKPLYMDECTKMKLRIPYARVLVEVDLSKRPAKSVKICTLMGETLDQPVVFEWVPKKSSGARPAGAAPRQPAKVWREKALTCEDRKSVV